LTVTKQAIPKNNSIEILNTQILDSISDVLGKNVVKLDMRSLEEAPTDYFIICEGDSSTQIKAIADRIRKDVKDNCSILPSHVEGERFSQWILLDYFNTVVHIFHPTIREFYQLEDLWSDANYTEYQNL
jgi:ribosome-associated protein